MSKLELFVVVREDRHVDDEITVHSTRELADAAVDEFIARYADRNYEWEEFPVATWVRNLETDIDDGPKVRVERTTLDPDGDA